MIISGQKGNSLIKSKGQILITQGILEALRVETEGKQAFLLVNHDTFVDIYAVLLLLGNIFFTYGESKFENSIAD